MDDELKNFLREIPKMDSLLSLPWVADAIESIGRDAARHTLEEVIAELRRSARDGTADLSVPPREQLEDRMRAAMDLRSSSSLRKVINATGVVVHTNLGRSALPKSALDAIARVSAGYSNLEYDLARGERGQRNSHVEWLVGQLSGAEASVVVNNNAAAVLLALSAVARGREVIVSAGELVEIGGSFRIPDILAFSGAKSVVVGCTNRTHPKDYIGAITDDTAMILKVHPSNYRVLGFTEEVPRAELAKIAHDRGLIFMEDLGSGLIEPIGMKGIGEEPTVRECIEQGVDLVTFSGDKLLGGPQMGVIAGRRDLIDRMRKDQIMRAMRVDKMTLAAFEEIMRLYLQGRSGEIPTVAMLRADRDELEARAVRLREMIACSCAHVPSLEVEVAEADDAVGGGSYPATALPGWGVAVTMRGGVSPEAIAARLRAEEPAVIGGIRDGAIIFHVRTLVDGDDRHIADALARILRA